MTVHELIEQLRTVPNQEKKIRIVPKQTVTEVMDTLTGVYLIIEEDKK